MQKFWNWVKNEDKRTLYLNGAISETSWFDDEVTPALFKSELEAGEGDIDLWINSPGGDCFAAAQIYNMISNYRGKVTVYIDGLAASAASVIAMAGDEVIMSPVSMLMIHNPSTIAFGEAADMEKVIAMLGEVKDSIINAYVAKTGLSRGKLSRLMDEETWMNANKAVELGFADSLRGRPLETEHDDTAVEDRKVIFSQKRCDMYVTNLLKNSVNVVENYVNGNENNIQTTSDTTARSDTPKSEGCEQNISDRESKVDEPEKVVTPTGRKLEAVNERMELMKNFIGGN